MVRAIYLPVEDWDNFYGSQAAQSGHGIPGFEGIAYQRGAGLGNVLGKLFRFVLPVAKKIGRVVGKRALATGADIVADVAKGKSFKEAAKEHGRRAAGDLAEQASSYLRGHGLGVIPKKTTTKPVGRKKKVITRKKSVGRRSVFKNVQIN